MQPLPNKDSTPSTATATFVAKITSLLFVAVVTLSVAVLSAFVQSAIVLLQSQTFTAEYKKVNDPSGLFDTFESVFSASNKTHPSSQSWQEEHANLVFVFDFWERMVNIQSGLRRLVNIGVESGFTVVEPFMYESRIQLSFSDPVQFFKRNMEPQPARHYFQTEDLFYTNSYVSYDEGVERIERVQDYAEGSPAYVIHAAVFFEWQDEIKEKQDVGQNREDITPFRWCDSRLDTLVSSDLGYMVSDKMFIERAVCLSINHTTSTSPLTPRYFHNLFSFVRNAQSNTNRRCKHCIALAFMNYRKHAFNKFQSSLGIQPFKQKVPPLEISAFGRELAARVRTDVLRKRPYVAVQMRTGKAFTLFEKQERTLMRNGTSIERYSMFMNWLKKCTQKVSSAAKRQGRELGRKTVFYIASDMFNDGWKGGEKCPEEVKKALDEAEQHLSSELHSLHRFEPELMGIRQDVMGTSSIADAAVSREADRFLFGIPSNFGKWVAEQREIAGKENALSINCWDERWQR